MKNKQEKNGAELIADERKRQVKELGWTPDHDDEHENGELAFAAVCYASPGPLFKRMGNDTYIEFIDPWPWDDKYDKRRFSGGKFTPNENLPMKKRIDLLVKAGALIAAEIDRLKRLRKSEPEKLVL